MSFFEYSMRIVLANKGIAWKIVERGCTRKDGVTENFDPSRLATQFTRF
jgi:hypothetical protein